MPSRRSVEQIIQIRSAGDAVRAWRDCRRLAALIEAKRKDMPRPRRHGRGEAGGPALALRAFVRFRHALIVQAMKLGVTWEEIQATVHPPEAAPSGSSSSASVAPPEAGEAAGPWKPGKLSPRKG